MILFITFLSKVHETVSKTYQENNIVYQLIWILFPLGSQKKPHRFVFQISYLYCNQYFPRQLFNSLSKRRRAHSHIPHTLQ